MDPELNAMLIYKTHSTQNQCFPQLFFVLPVSLLIVCDVHFEAFDMSVKQCYVMGFIASDYLWIWTFVLQGLCRESHVPGTSLCPLFCLSFSHSVITVFGCLLYILSVLFLKAKNVWDMFSYCTFCLC